MCLQDGLGNREVRCWRMQETDTSSSLHFLARMPYVRARAMLGGDALAHLSEEKQQRPSQAEMPPGALGQRFSSPAWALLVTLLGPQSDKE